MMAFEKREISSPVDAESSCTICHDPENSSPTEHEMRTPDKSPGSEAPDGGLAAWLVVLGAWCTSFCSFGWVNST